jgi:hypothetical protein
LVLKLLVHTLLPSVTFSDTSLPSIPLTTLDAGLALLCACQGASPYAHQLMQRLEMQLGLVQQRADAVAPQGCDKKSEESSAPEPTDANTGCVCAPAGSQRETAAAAAASTAPAPCAAAVAGAAATGPGRKGTSLKAGPDGSGAVDDDTRPERDQDKVAAIPNWSSGPGARSGPASDQDPGTATKKTQQQQQQGVSSDQGKENTGSGVPHSTGASSQPGAAGQKLHSPAIYHRALAGEWCWPGLCAACVCHSRCIDIQVM